VDPSVVPGVLFANHAVQDTHPRLLDIAPTVLEMFGCPVPDYMDGQALTVGQRAGSTESNIATTKADVA
jgi:arylsulfatase A-like enzyme